MSTKAKYNITHDNDEPSSITVFFPGQPMPQVATATHKNFDHIVGACKRGDSPDVIKELFNVGHTLVKRFNKVTERVSLAGGQLFFDNDPVDNALTQMIVAFHVEGQSNFEPLVRFFEKLQENPNQHSREQLYGWMAKHKFGIMPDGDFVAYKGVHPTNGDDNVFRSVSSGRAIVNGEVHTGTIPTSPGVVVEMPRSEVNHNPREGCSTGLHAGDWSYASGFARTTLRVKINPRDVVSVPTDCGDRKMRVCRYRVLGPVIGGPNGQEPEGLFHPDDELRTLAMEAVEPEAVAESRAEAKTSKRKSRRAERVAATAKKAARKLKELDFPKFYEDFTVKNFRQIEYKRLQWLAKEWEVKVSAPRAHEDYALALAKESSKRRRQLKSYKELSASEKRKVAKDDKPSITRLDT